MYITVNHVGVLACWAVLALGMCIVWRPCGLGECVTHGLLLSRQRPRGLERTQDMRTGPRAAWRSDHRGGRCSTPRAPLLCDSGLAPAAPGYAPTSLWHPRLLVATRHLLGKKRGWGTRHNIHGRLNFKPITLRDGHRSDGAKRFHWESTFVCDGY